MGIGIHPVQCRFGFLDHGIGFISEPCGNFGGETDWISVRVPEVMVSPGALSGVFDPETGEGERTGSLAICFSSTCPKEGLS